jgi:hypothetical protein
MGRNAMGSTREDLITAEEAAESLGVSTAMIHKMTTRGLLSPVDFGKRRLKYFRRAEVAAVASIRMTKLDLATTANMAVRALALAQSNDRRLDELSSILGLQGTSLSLEENEVVALFIKTQDALKEDCAPTASEIREWAKVFLRISEEYLRVVVLHTAAPEPWKPFMLLGEKLAEEAPREKFSKDDLLTASYGFLEVARRHLRHVAYFYIRNERGAPTANKKFPNVEGGVDELMIGLLFLH